MSDMTLEEFERRVEAMPLLVGTALKETAHRYAERVATRAAEILRSKTHGTGKTARSIRIIDQTDRKQWYVQCPGDESDPANLPMWLEYGTRYMTARSFIRPAGDEVSDAYQRDMTRVAEMTLAGLLE